MKAPRTGLTLLALVAAGVLSFGAFLILSAYAPMLRQGDDASAHALSRSAVGYHALGDLLEAQGADVQRLRIRHVASSSAPGLSVFAPPSEEMSDIALPRDAIALVIVPKWVAVPHTEKRGWAQFLTLRRAEEGSLTVGGRTVSFALERDVDTENNDKSVTRDVTLTRSLIYRTAPKVSIGEVEALQTFSGPDIEPLWTDEQGQAVLGRVKLDGYETSVFILSDPDLANTQGLAHPARATVASELVMLLSGRDPVVFDLTLNGFSRPRNLITLLVEPPLLAATLATLLTALFVGARALQRFGPALRDEGGMERGKTAIIETTAQLLVTPGNSGELGRIYAEQLREDVALHRRAADDRTRRAMDAELASFEAMAEEAATSRRLDELVAASKVLFQRKRKIENE